MRVKDMQDDAMFEWYEPLSLRVRVVSEPSRETP